MLLRFTVSFDTLNHVHPGGAPLTKKRLRIGLFGGSFDPVHTGHVQLARAALAELHLDRIIFIPARQPPHKKKRSLTSSARRCAMLSLALKPYPYFSLSRFELKRSSTTYTYQTLQYFRKRFPDAELFFIIGSDSLAELHRWRRSGLLAALTTFIVGKRPDVLAEKFLFPGNARFLRHPVRKVSSSDIRVRGAEGKSIRGLVPETVRKYIQKHKLYKIINMLSPCI